MDNEIIELRLTKEQESAVKSLERALKKCHEQNIYIHNCYGTLFTYNGAEVEKVTDDISKIPCYNGRSVTSKYDFDGWADDNHFVHLHA